MTIEQMRSYIRAEYPGPKWKNNVDHMPDSQVLAVYKRIYAKNTSKKG